VIGKGSRDRNGIAGARDRVRGRRGGGRAPHGGMVTETGIALVEQGEMVVPARGSRAELELAHAEAGTEVHIHLPVVVEVVGRNDDSDLERIADETLRRLRVAIEAQPAEG
jgi:hypothetical protein